MFDIGTSRELAWEQFRKDHPGYNPAEWQLDFLADGEHCIFTHTECLSCKEPLDDIEYDIWEETSSTRGLVARTL